MKSFLRAFAMELIACVRETRADGGGEDVLLNTSLAQGYMGINSVLLYANVKQREKM